VSGFSSTAVKRLRARRVRRLLLIIGVLLVVLIGVALLPQGGHRGPLAVATSARSGTAAPIGVVQGALLAARDGRRVCYSIDSAQGRVLLVFPPGWSADTALRLLDDTGQTRATAGARMSFLGTPGGTGTVPGCRGGGRLWYASDVRLPTQTGGR
jgi:hypothetical protein